MYSLIILENKFSKEIKWIGENLKNFQIPCSMFKKVIQVGKRVEEKLTDFKHCFFFLHASFPHNSFEIKLRRKKQLIPMKLYLVDMVLAFAFSFEVIFHASAYAYQPWCPVVGILEIYGTRLRLVVFPYHSVICNSLSPVL